MHRSASLAIARQRSASPGSTRHFSEPLRTPHHSLPLDTTRHDSALLSITIHSFSGRQPRRRYLLIITPPLPLSHINLDDVIWDPRFPHKHTHTQTHTQTHRHTHTCTHLHPGHGYWTLKNQMSVYADADEIALPICGTCRRLPRLRAGLRPNRCILPQLFDRLI